MKRIFEVQTVSMTYVFAENETEATALSDAAQPSERIARISKCDARIAYMLPAELADREIVGGNGITVVEAVDVVRKIALQ